MMSDMAAAPARVLALLSLLQVRREWPVAALADRLEVSGRTVRRDVDQLREMGYRIQAVKGPHGGYRLDAGAELPPLFFDDEQAVALAVALQGAAASGAAIGDGALRAQAALRTVLPPRLRHRAETMAMTAVPPAGPVVDPAVLLAVDAAARAREVLRFDYRSPAEPASAAHPASEPGTLPVRRAEPYRVVARRGRWYLVAWDLDRGDWRVFRLDRMTPRAPTGPRFAPRELPGGDAAAFVAARARGRDDASGPDDEWPCTGAVVLEAPAHAVLPFAGDGAVEPLGEARCRLTAGSWSWIGLAASIARFDADVTSAEPAELAAAFATLARRFAGLA